MKTLTERIQSRFGAAHVISTMWKYGEKFGCARECQKRGMRGLWEEIMDELELPHDTAAWMSACQPRKEFRAVISERTAMGNLASNNID